MNQRIRILGQAAAALAALCAASLSRAVPTSSPTFTAPTTPTLRINEVIASGSGGDRIELHNAGATAIDLTGKVLQDQAADPANPTRFVFPAGATIAAGGYLVVFADSVTGAGHHTGFSLDAEGDEVRLYDSVAAANADNRADFIKFGFQVADFSISRTGTAANVWALTTPTLGAANAAPLALGSVATLKINEWAAKINFRLDHDLIELFNPAGQPVALGGAGLTDDATRPKKFSFPTLSFIGATGFLPLYGADFVFDLERDREVVTLFGENNEQIDQVTIQSQPADRSSGRSPDGMATIVDLAVPTPGISNTTPLPPAYNDLLNNLRITEVMYDPAAESNASQFEFIELQNIGSTTLNLSGVRFTNGLEYEFAAGSTLAPGAFVVVVNDRSSFLSRYPNAAGVMAPGGFNGSLDNTGETIALTLPSPWRVHILRFRYEPTWYSSTSRGGYSLVPVAPATAAPQEWQVRTAWRASAAVNGSPGAADPGTPAGGTSNARLANLSVRTTMAAEQNLIVGFVVGGGSRDILVRAAGPGLTALGLAGAMTDPRLDLYAPALVLSNNDWSSGLANVFASVAAFPFATGSRDAAFLQPIADQASVHTRGTGPGIVLVEAYDTGGGNAARLVNVSARNRVGTGDDILIAGFNISGTGAKQLLIRAVGPKLTTFGVPGVLADPKLEVFAGTTKLRENDNWSNDLAATFAAVGAFTLDANSRDAALVTSLEPGTYTVQVSGVNGGTGEALVEIYEVP